MSDVDVNQMAQWLVAAAAIFFFTSMSYVSVTFFLIEDDGARFGKKLISILAGSAALYVCWQLLISVPRTCAVSLVSALLFAYAIGMLFSAKYVTASRPLNFAMSNKVPTQLVTQGPYRFVRHPFYSAYCAAWLASLIQLQSWYIAAVFGAMLGIYFRTALTEERAFKDSAFSVKYQAYMAETGMLIPMFSKRKV